MLRILRGVIGTALAFAVPWALVGSALAVGIAALWPGASSQGPMPEFYVWVARSGPVVFGVLGGLAGALYALMLALSGRRLSFDQLTTTRVLGLGAAGGLAVGSAVFGAAGLYFGIWPAQYSIGVGIASVLGAGSASVLLALARRSPQRQVLAIADEPPSPARMAAAQTEVELLLRGDAAAPGAVDRKAAASEQSRSALP